MNVPLDGTFSFKMIYSNGKRGVRMKKYFLILWAVIAFLIGIPAPEAAAKSFEITDYDVLVEIQEDGSAFFTEQITYDFDGAFNGVLYHLDISNIQTPTDVKVSMRGEGQQDAFPFASSSSEEPGTFSLENTGDFLNFTVYNPIENEVQTVIYEYRIPEIITNYNDIAELNRKIIGGGWEHPLENVHITITLPQAVKEGELRAWGHGDRAGEVSLKDNRSVLLTVPYNPVESFVEARVIFPTYVTGNNPHVVKEDKYEEIMAFEENLAVRKEQRGKISLAFGLFLGIMSPLLTLFLFRWLKRKDREANPHPAHVPDHIYQLPSDLAPAVMNASVFNKYPGTTEITATIMNLVRRGYLRIEESGRSHSQKLFEKEKQDFTLLLVKQPDGNLLSHEESLLHLFIDIAGNGKEVSFSEIENIGQHKEQARAFHTERETWVKDVEKDSQELKDRFIAAHATKATGLLTLTVLANVFLFFLTGLVIGVTRSTLWTLLFPAAGIVLTIFLVYYHSKNPSLTSEGDRAQKEWSGFRNMLADVGNFPMREVGSIEVWGHYLVYAIALGVGDRVMEQMQIEYPVEEWDHTAFGTYYFTSYLFVNSLNRSVESGITSSSATVNTSGTGGGFSGGSSGGTGGGSGGGAF